jgi:hypothetical protein
MVHQHQDSIARMGQGLSPLQAAGIGYEPGRNEGTKEQASQGSPPLSVMCNLDLIHRQSPQATAFR